MITPFFNRDIVLNSIGRKVLKIPMGIAIYREPPYSIKIFEELKAFYKTPMIISVGDVVTHNLLQYNGGSDIAIIDKKTLRTKDYLIEKEFLAHYNTVFECKNPRGGISRECASIIKKSIRLCLNKEKRVLIIIDGEEDLLVMPSLIFSPNKSFVLYGHWLGSLNILIVNDYLKMLTLQSIRKFFK